MLLRFWPITLQHNVVNLVVSLPTVCKKWLSLWQSPTVGTYSISQWSFTLQLTWQWLMKLVVQKQQVHEHVVSDKRLRRQTRTHHQKSHNKDSQWIAGGALRFVVQTRNEQRGKHVERRQLSVIGTLVLHINLLRWRTEDVVDGETEDTDFIGQINIHVSDLYSEFDTVVPKTWIDLNIPTHNLKLPSLTATISLKICENPTASSRSLWKETQKKLGRGRANDKRGGGGGGGRGRTRWW